MKCRAKDGECSDGGRAVAIINCGDLRSTPVCSVHLEMHRRHSTGTATDFQVIKTLNKKSRSKNYVTILDRLDNQATNDIINILHNYYDIRRKLEDEKKAKEAPK